MSHLRWKNCGANTHIPQNKHVNILRVQIAKTQGLIHRTALPKMRPYIRTHEEKRPLEIDNIFCGAVPCMDDHTLRFQVRIVRYAWLL